jgi:hypothetical protein
MAIDKKLTKMFINSVTSKPRASSPLSFMVNLSSPFLALVLAVSAAGAATPQNPATTPTTPQDPIAPFRDEIAASPAAAPAIITRTLRSAGSQAASLAGPITSAAIENLGPAANRKRISSIVFSAVRAVPGSVLEIVRAAVPVAPKSAADIAAAAAAAVPNPWKEVRYQRQTGLGGKVDAVVTAGSAGFTGTAMTLAGAIVHTAFDAETTPATLANPQNPPNPAKLAPIRERDFKDSDRDFKDAVEAAQDPAVGLSTIQSAVDAALLDDPGQLLSKIGDPRGLSGVGEVGSSNFANEPPDPHHRAKPTPTPTPSPTPTPPPTPTPTPPPKPSAPPVSQ